jgi:ABC-type antimicrobial peptide transport system permease subunit
MRSLTLIGRSLRYFRRSHAALALGTALSAAILTGALIVGDSVDHTLRTHAGQRLGSVAQAVVSQGRSFSGEVVAPWRERLGVNASGLLVLPGMAIRQDDTSGVPLQIPRVNVQGVEETFWSFGDGPAWALGRRDIVLNERLARALDVREGDRVALRIAKPGLLSRDAPLSSREDEGTVRANFSVSGIAPDAALGRFSLSPSQVPPYNCFVSLEALQDLAETGPQINLLIAGENTTTEAARDALDAVWQPAFGGLQVTTRAEGVLLLESKNVFLEEAEAEAAMSIPGAQGTLNYLVNGIRGAAGATPYSFMTAGGAMAEGLADNAIVINQWLADQLDAKAGDSLTVAYYEVTASNEFIERERAFTVERVLPMDALNQERALVPDFPGLSNVESCKDWKIGMPMDAELLRDEPNEAYWKTYRQTPKAFVSLAAGQAMWANRFGSLTGVRFDAAQTSPDEIMAALGAQLGPREFGLEVRPVRDEAAAAVANATDLGGLFIGMSFFLLLSALILTGMLYAFGAQQRAREAGLLRAVGFPRSRVYALWVGETAIIAVPGAILGAALGAGYAALLLFGLSYWWQDVVGRIPMIFAARPQSLATGVLFTVLCALLAAAWTLRRLLAHNASALLTADFTQASRVKVRGRCDLIVSAVLLALAMGLVIYALVQPPADPAGVFFGSGFLALLGGLALTRHALSAAPSAGQARVPSLWSFARMNAARRRGRSLGLVATLAAGGFLVLAVSSMQGDLSANADQRWSGTGGFEIYAETTLPVLELEEIAPAAERLVPLRVLDGDDASCLNLNQALRPRVIGVDPGTMAELGAFTGAGAGLWPLLDQDYGPDVIPALVGDSDTAMWTLKKKTGPETGDLLEYRDDAGRAVSLKLVGKLPMRLSVFQGSVLVSARNFTERWPSREGFRLFLVDASSEEAAAVQETLRKELDREGIEVMSTVDRLEMFHAVEATYLNMFLLLGGLGLLLGAAATGVVVLRNLLERRGEIALLRAVGFSAAAVFRLFALECVLLLGLATLIGASASVLAMLPALFAAHGGASPLWRLTVLALVAACAGLSAWAALVAGLRRVEVTALREDR